MLRLELLTLRPELTELVPLPELIPRLELTLRPELLFVLPNVLTLRVVLGLLRMVLLFAELRIAELKDEPRELPKLLVLREPILVLLPTDLLPPLVNPDALPRRSEVAA